MKVLVAEDNNRVRATAVEHLTAHGHSVIEAARGFEAVKMAGEHRPEVIILDGLMPDMHGFEVARFIRAMDSEYQPRIILMTAIYKNNHYQNEAKLRYGIDRYLIKPVTAEKLQEAVVGDYEWLAFNVDATPTVLEAEAK